MIILASTEVELAQRIVVDPGILHGKPRIKGTRIPISIILEWLEEGFNFQEIIDAYPQLKSEDIKAVLVYMRELVENREIVAFGSSD